MGRVGNRRENNQKEHQKLFSKVLKNLRVGKDAELIQMKDGKGYWYIIVKSCRDGEKTFNKYTDGNKYA